MNRVIRWSIADEAETDRFGRGLAASLEPGTVVALVGDLGAGKTRLVRAVAVALDVPADEVQSPTFVLIREYDGRLPLYHFDTYRLADVDEFLELGADEFLHGGGVCLVEWADRVAEVLPRDVLRLEIEATGATRRAIRGSAGGPRSTAVLGRLEAAIAPTTSQTTESGQVIGDADPPDEA